MTEKQSKDDPPNFFLSLGVTVALGILFTIYKKEVVSAFNNLTGLKITVGDLAIFYVLIVILFFKYSGKLINPNREKGE